jgi:hypothetical protein
VTATSAHPLNVTAPTGIDDPTAPCADAPAQAAVPQVKDRACAAQIRTHLHPAPVEAQRYRGSGPSLGLMPSRMREE